MKNETNEIPEESPTVFIKAIINTKTDTLMPSDAFGEKILDIIGQTPEKDIEFVEPNLNIAHRPDMGIDIHYSVGFTAN